LVGQLLVALLSSGTEEGSAFFHLTRYVCSAPPPLFPFSLIQAPSLLPVFTKNFSPPDHVALQRIESFLIWRIAGAPSPDARTFPFFPFVPCPCARLHSAEVTDTFDSFILLSSSSYHVSPRFSWDDQVAEVSPPFLLSSSQQKVLRRDAGALLAYGYRRPHTPASVSPFFHMLYPDRPRPFPLRSLFFFILFLLKMRCSQPRIFNTPFCETASIPIFLQPRSPLLAFVAGKLPSSFPFFV